MNAYTLDRLQFAFTITYHYLFPQLTMGLAPLIVVFKTLAIWKKDERYNQAARFWGKIFGITFLFGVVTGILMEFQFGTNWAAFAASNFYLASMLGGAVFALYPNVLPAMNPAYNLTIENASAGNYGLSVGLIWWSIGILIALGYFYYVFKTFKGKVKLESH